MTSKRIQNGEMGEALRETLNQASLVTRALQSQKASHPIGGLIVTADHALVWMDGVARSDLSTFTGTFDVFGDRGDDAYTIVFENGHLTGVQEESCTQYQSAGPTTQTYVTPEESSCLKKLAEELHTPVTAWFIQNKSLHTPSPRLEDAEREVVLTNWNKTTESEEYPLFTPKDRYDEWRRLAEERGQTVSRLIMDVMRLP